MASGGVTLLVDRPSPAFARTSRPCLTRLGSRVEMASRRTASARSFSSGSLTYSSSFLSRWHGVAWCARSRRAIVSLSCWVQSVLRVGKRTPAPANCTPTCSSVPFSSCTWVGQVVCQSVSGCRRRFFKGLDG